MQKQQILFVCLGNICRSPMAECIMNDLVTQAGLASTISCDSAGTSSYHLGNSPDRRMVSAARQRGLTLRGTARQITAADLAKFDLIVAMDRENYNDILALDPVEQYHHKVKMMVTFFQEHTLKEIPDPYLSRGTDGFNHVIDLLTDACGGLLEQLQLTLPEDPLWTQITKEISEVTSQPFTIKNRRSITGGSINQAHLVMDDQRRYFVKLNQACHSDLFEAEQAALEYLRSTNVIRLPQPITHGIVADQSYLVMEWIDFSNERKWEDLGRQLAQLHRLTGKAYGWFRDNHIGLTPQTNTWTSDWGKFFMEQRLGYQLQLAKTKGFDMPRIPQLLSLGAKIFAGHQPAPSLVHGDLHSGNVGFTVTGEPVMFDPAPYFGDREVDLAMTDLFGGFPSAFKQGYQQVYPLEPGYSGRKNIYNLYHVLNHFNLFGNSYRGEAESLIGQIVRDWSEPIIKKG